ncbi:MAG: hypothetical protein WCI04_00660 [archaeon]
MLVSWSRHSKERFAERAAKNGLNYGDVEFEIKKQSVKIKQEDDKFKTIFCVGKEFLTAVKAETRDYIHVLTLWESSESEVDLWKKK